MQNNKFFIKGNKNSPFLLPSPVFILCPMEQNGSIFHCVDSVLWPCFQVNSHSFNHNCCCFLHILVKMIDTSSLFFVLFLIVWEVKFWCILNIINNIKQMLQFDGRHHLSNRDSSFICWEFPINFTIKVLSKACLNAPIVYLMPLKANKLFFLFVVLHFQNFMLQW